MQYPILIHLSCSWMDNFDDITNNTAKWFWLASTKINTK